MDQDQKETFYKMKYEEIFVEKFKVSSEEGCMFFKLFSNASAKALSGSELKEQKALSLIEDFLKTMRSLFPNQNSEEMALLGEVFHRLTLGSMNIATPSLKKLRMMKSKINMVKRDAKILLSKTYEGVITEGIFNSLEMYIQSCAAQLSFVDQQIKGVSKRRSTNKNHMYKGYLKPVAEILKARIDNLDKSYRIKEYSPGIFEKGSGRSINALKIVSNASVLLGNKTNEKTVRTRLKMR